MDMDLLIELAVRAVKAYLEKEGITSAVQAERKVNSALILTEHHCEECAVEKLDSELCKVTCALAQNYEVNVDDFDSIVLYNMTNSNLFKIANGCTDNKFLALAAEAILKGKRVIMVNGEVGMLEYGESAPKALYNSIYKNLQILLDSGVKLVSAEDVKDVICEGADAPAEPAREEVKAVEAASAPVAAAPKAESDDSVLVLTKRVITERDIREAAAKHYKKVQLPEKPVITYLAKDTAFELGIELI